MISLASLHAKNEFSNTKENVPFHDLSPWLLNLFMSIFGCSIMLTLWLIERNTRKCTMATMHMYRHSGQLLHQNYSSYSLAHIYGHDLPMHRSASAACSSGSCVATCQLLPILAIAIAHIYLISLISKCVIEYTL